MDNAEQLALFNNHVDWLDTWEQLGDPALDALRTSRHTEGLTRYYTDYQA